MKFIAKFITACGCEKIEEINGYAKNPPEIFERAMLISISNYREDWEPNDIEAYQRTFRHTDVEYYSGGSVVHVYREVKNQKRPRSEEN